MPNPNSNLNKIPHMNPSIRSVGTASAPILHPEDTLNSRLQPMTSIPASRQAQNLDVYNDIRYEKPVYSPPTQVSKGLTTSSAGGSFTLYDVTGGTKIFDYNPKTGVVTIIGTLVSQQINSGTYTNIVFAGTNSVVGTLMSGFYGTPTINNGSFSGTSNYPINVGSPALGSSGAFEIQTKLGSVQLAVRSGTTTYFFSPNGTQ